MARSSNHFPYSYDRNRRPLDNDDLMRLAPAVFAEEPWDQVSRRYEFVPTIQVIDRMRNEGFIPVYAAQGRTRIEGKQDFTKHMIVLRHRDSLAISSDMLDKPIGEVIMVNSHDKTTAYQFMCGFFRYICTNGMIAGDIESNIRLTHTTTDLFSFIMEHVLEAADHLPRLTDTFESWRGLRVNEPSQLTYAQSAIDIRYGSDDDDEEDENIIDHATQQPVKKQKVHVPITPNQLLVPHRLSDRQPDLFHVYQNVQENIMKGGMRGITRSGGRTRVRGIATSSVAQDIKINKALWRLTERMGEILTGK